MSQRIVILTRHFPPQVSGGARRPYLLAQCLQAMGHKVTVVAPSGPAETDYTLIRVPHAGDRKRAETSHSPEEPRPGVRSFLRRYLLIPDADIRWALKAARAVGPLNSTDWLITSSPPESVHVAGALLKNRSGCRWLADFRDSWLQTPLRHEVRHGRYIRRWLERCVAKLLLRRADCVSATTFEILAELRTYGAHGPGEVIGHFSDAPGEPVPLPEETINLVHTGSFSASDPARHIKPVLEAFEKAGRDDLRLYLIGRLTAAEHDAVGRSTRSAQITCPGLRDRAETMRYQASADVLLLAAAPDSTHIPGKLAEYAAANRPILSIGGGAWRQTMPFPTSTDSDGLAALLRDLHKGRLDEPGSVFYSSVASAPEDAAAKLLELMGNVSPARRAG